MFLQFCTLAKREGTFSGDGNNWSFVMVTQGHAASHPAIFKHVEAPLYHSSERGRGMCIPL
jgi:hypothetical protein